LFYTILFYSLGLFGQSGSMIISFATSIQQVPRYLNQ
jgi:hypothetical protein